MFTTVSTFFRRRPDCFFPLCYSYLDVVEKVLQGRIRLTLVCVRSTTHCICWHPVHCSWRRLVGLSSLEFFAVFPNSEAPNLWAIRSVIVYAQSQMMTEEAREQTACNIGVKKGLYSRTFRDCGFFFLFLNIWRTNKQSQNATTIETACSNTRRFLLTVLVSRQHTPQSTVLRHTISFTVSEMFPALLTKFSETRQQGIFFSQWKLDHVSLKRNKQRSSVSELLAFRQSTSD